MNDVSVVLLTTGEETTLRAVESLKKQTLKPVETIIIENVTPFHNAINAGIRRVKTDYFVQLDSDFVLDENCIEILKIPCLIKWQLQLDNYVMQFLVLKVE